MMMDSTGVTQQMSEKMDTVSLAPHAIWGLLGAHMKFSGNASLRLKHTRRQSLLHVAATNRFVCTVE